VFFKFTTLTVSKNWFANVICARKTCVCMYVYVHTYVYDYFFQYFLEETLYRYDNEKLYWPLNSNELLKIFVRISALSRSETQLSHSIYWHFVLFFYKIRARDLEKSRIRITRTYRRSGLTFISDYAWIILVAHCDRHKSRQ